MAAKKNKSIAELYKAAMAEAAPTGKKKAKKKSSKKAARKYPLSELPRSARKYPLSGLSHSARKDPLSELSHSANIVKRAKALIASAEGRPCPPSFGRIASKRR